MIYVLTLFTRFASAKDDITPAHPLEESLANVSHYALSLAVLQIYRSVCVSLSPCIQQAAREEALRMQVMRDTQGRHMPLRLLMERSIVSRVSLEMCQVFL